MSRVPGLPELVEHLRKHGFLPLMTGDNGSERKLYFYAEEIVDVRPGSCSHTVVDAAYLLVLYAQGTRVMVFLAEFKFAVATKKLDATFKSHTKTHIQQVRVCTDVEPRVPSAQATHEVPLHVQKFNLQELFQVVKV